MPKIVEIYAWVAATADGVHEEIPVAYSELHGRPLPLVTADIRRAMAAMNAARRIADQWRRPVRLVRSTGLELIKTIEPPGRAPRTER